MQRQISVTLKKLRGSRVARLPETTTISISHSPNSSSKSIFHRAFILPLALLGGSTKSLLSNAFSCFGATSRQVKGGSFYTYQDLQLVDRTKRDALLTIPMTLFVSCPGSMFLLPHLLRRFPGILPSTYHTEEFLIKRIPLVRQKLVESVKQVLQQNSNLRALSDISLKHSAGLLSQVINSQSRVDYNTLAHMKEFCRVVWTFGKMKPHELKAACNIFQLSCPFILAKSRLYHRTSAILYGDSFIRRSQVSTLTPSELDEALLFRGFSSALKKSDIEKRQILERHVQFTKNLTLEESSLLVLIRVLGLDE